MAPLRPGAALVWLAAVSGLQRLVSIEEAWLLVVIAPGVGLGMWIAGVVPDACAAAFEAA